MNEQSKEAAAGATAAIVAEKVVNGDMTINEARAQLGMQPIAAGDRLLSKFDGGQAGMFLPEAIAKALGEGKCVARPFWREVYNAKLKLVDENGKVELRSADGAESHPRWIPTAGELMAGDWIVVD